MDSLPEYKKNYQAEVHFTLGTVIQGITVAALGDEVAKGLRSHPLPDALWFYIAASQSLVLCILFWYRFMDNYYFGFRISIMSPGVHFVLTTLHILLGIQQFIAIRVLDMPKLWFSMYVLMISTMIIGSWLTSYLMEVHDKGMKKALEHDPGSKWLFLFFLVSVICLIIWHAAPGLESELFRGIAMGSSILFILLFSVYSIQVFQWHQQDKF